MKRLFEYIGMIAVVALASFGVAQAVLSVPEPGLRLVDGFSIVSAVNNHNNIQSVSGITARAGGGQATAVQLLFGISQINTVATTADSVALPECSPGAVMWVLNDGANSMTVFSKVGRTDTIDGTAGATGLAQAAGIEATYICTKLTTPLSGTWRRLNGA